MKRFLSTLLLATVACLTHAQNVTYNGTKPAVIIDVRTPQEFASGHIAGAINIPHERIGTGVANLKGISKTSPVLLYCRSGNRSGLAKNALESLGYSQVVNGGSLGQTQKKLKTCASPGC